MAKMKKYNKSKIMKRAWNLFKGNTKMNNFSECLKKAWAEAKEAVKVTVKYSIKDWFYKKLIEEKRSGSWIVYSTFSKEDVVKETEKLFALRWEFTMLSPEQKAPGQKNAGFRSPAFTNIDFRCRGREFVQNKKAPVSRGESS